MVILIVLIAGAVKVARMYYRDRQEARGATPQIDENIASQIHALEERVRVLETIVTDKRHDLRREIDSL
jgi:hypothetical protein